MKSQEFSETRETNATAERQTGNACAHLDSDLADHRSAFTAGCLCNRQDGHPAVVSLMTTIEME